MEPDDADDERERATVREILSANVRKLIEDAKTTRPHLGSILKVSEASKELTHGSSTLSKSRVGRIVTGSHPTDIDALTDLAEVFGLQPWQLLVENLNPKALPQLADAEFITRLERIVASASRQTQEISPSLTDEQRVQSTQQHNEASVGAALQKSFIKSRDKKNARRGAAPPSKPRSGGGG